MKIDVGFTVAWFFIFLGISVNLLLLCLGIHRIGLAIQLLLLGYGIFWQYEYDKIKKEKRRTIK